MSKTKKEIRRGTVAQLIEILSQLDPQSEVIVSDKKQNADGDRFVQITVFDNEEDEWNPLWDSEEITGNYALSQQDLVRLRVSRND